MIALMMMMIALMMMMIVVVMVMRMMRYIRLVCDYEEDWMQISRALSGGVSADVSVFHHL